MRWAVSCRDVRQAALAVGVPGLRQRQGEEAGCQANMRGRLGAVNRLVVLVAGVVTVARIQGDRSAGVLNG
jgi:hypothetical protein